jgi:hypothetical protein
MSIEEAPTMEVLKFDEQEAYNHDRPISSLIRTQLLHLHQAEHIALPPKARTNTNINDLRTERQASEYIRKVTRLLHKYGKSRDGRQPAKTKKKSAKKRVSRSNKRGQPTQKKRNSRTR